MRLALIISFILAALMIASGCSKEEEEPVITADSTSVIRRPIEKPGPATSEKTDSVKIIDESATAKPDELKSQVKVSDAGKEKIEPRIKEGDYVVLKGDSLSKIADRKNVYNSFLKWPILYRDNRKLLTKYKAGPDLPDIELSPGIVLKFITESDFQNNLREQPENRYVANVLSSPDMKKIVPVAVRLIDEGYFTYLTEIKVNGADWYRLRIGFFRTKSEAQETGRKIKGLLGINEIWATEIGDDEFREFGGY